ncbi:MAG: type II toxin-antitoxin system HicA family toxin [Bacteroidales bacterium]|nr:type II toxin-antitoxin system HicA family toxin [Bacteroidales bacterium]
MGTKEKLLDRFLSMTRDFTYDEVVRLFRIFGFEESNKGATSGSRVTFTKGNEAYDMHKPHPGKIVDRGALKGIKRFLDITGELNIYLFRNGNAEV